MRCELWVNNAQGSYVIFFILFSLYLTLRNMKDHMFVWILECIAPIGMPSKYKENFRGQTSIEFMIFFTNLNFFLVSSKEFYVREQTLILTTKKNAYFQLSGFQFSVHHSTIQFYKFNPSV